MGYQQNKNFNNNKKSFNKQDRPRNKNMNFDIKLTGITSNGRDYKIQTAIDLLDDLNNASVFNKLSVPVQISRATIDNNADLRGNITVGYIKSVDNNLGAELTVYSNCVDKIERLSNLFIVPRMLIDRDENVVTFLGFDLVNN